MLATKLVLGIGKSPKLIRSQSFDTTGLPFSPSTPKLRGENLRETVLLQNIQASKLVSPDQTDTNTPIQEEDISEDETDYALIDSNKFLYGVFLACLVVQVRKFSHSSNLNYIEKCW